MRKIKTVLLLSLIATGGFALPTRVDNKIHQSPFLMPLFAKGNTQIQSHHMGLSKKAALVWKQVGSTHYDNVAMSGSATVWAFGTRDTTVYDGDGNVILAKTSWAKTGWAIDSLESLDSSIYIGGNLAEEVTYYYSFGATGMSGYRMTYSYLKGGTIIVENNLKWNNVKKTWVPAYKDSIIFSAPIRSGEWFTDLTNLVGVYTYNFDTVGLSWKINSYFAKIDSESNETTLTFEGKAAVSYITDSLVDAKEILVFASSIMIMQNVIQSIEQRRVTLSGKYYDFSKSIFTLNANGYKTSSESYSWNLDTHNITSLSKYLYFPDAHGNDTLEIDIEYNTTLHIWDTTNMYPEVRTYDTYGNNTVTVSSFYDYPSYSWIEFTKDVNTFALINSPVIRPVQSAKKQGFSVVATAARVVVTAPEITGLALYNAAGRIVANVKQQPAASISLDLVRNNVSSGVYIASLARGGKQDAFGVSVQR
jgi:hypothetical protein